MMHEKRIVLDSRLSMIAEMVGRCDSYADIGCDHGRLGAFLLQSGWVQRAMMMDISDASLDKARALVRLLGLEDRAEIIVGDGAEHLESAVDCVVIAGMGGTTAAGIVERGRERLGGARLILQANVANPELRERLARVGYRISDERIVKDGRRYYIIIEAIPGKAEYSDMERLVGPILLKNQPDQLSGYADFRIHVAKKALIGAENGANMKAIHELREEIRIWEDVLSHM